MAADDRSTLDAREKQIDWAALEDLMHVDPAGRGLASFRRERRSLDAGQLRGAAVDLAKRATAVGIVTGFAIAADDRITAETDGDLVMGLSHKTHPVHGVQFHPESIASEHGQSILKNFLDLAAQWNAARRA